MLGLQSWTGSASLRQKKMTELSRLSEPPIRPAAITVFSQRRAFRRSTNIARRWRHKSIWATRSALVFALRLLRLSRAVIGPYWNLPATEYQSGHKKAARGSLQPELAFPSERKVSGQSTNIARRWRHKSIWATRSALVFALRLLRLSRAAIGPYWSLSSCSPLGP
jgi:hypothetical protein